MALTVAVLGVQEDPNQMTGTVQAAKEDYFYANHKRLDGPFQAHLHCVPRPAGVAASCRGRSLCVERAVRGRSGRRCRRVP